MVAAYGKGWTASFEKSAKYCSDKILLYQPNFMPVRTYHW